MQNDGKFVHVLLLHKIQFRIEYFFEKLWLKYTPLSLVIALIE